jgi:hypothetical protein
METHWAIRVKQLIINRLFAGRTVGPQIWTFTESDANANGT